MSSTDTLKPKSVFINQVDGGYVMNLQGNNHYPVKIAVTTEAMAEIVKTFFDTAEIITNEQQQTGNIASANSTFTGLPY
jgi:hypothetical protein